MTDDTTDPKADFEERVRADMLDSFDEELEEELDDDRLAALLDHASDHPDEKSVEPLGLFQGTVPPAARTGQAAGLGQRTTAPKVVVLFEGRDSAGKGGVIKRITQRLNPRVCRVVALPAPSEREQQPMVFPALCRRICPRRGEIVLFDRSWYNRAGVERVMGFCTEDEVRGILPLRAGIRAHAGALGHHADQILVLDHRRGAAFPLPDAHPRSAQAMEAQPDGPAIARALGGITPRPRKTCSSAPTSPRRPGG